jgi:subtilisin family serine protease
VTIYVIDSGIRAAHLDFGGRASVAADFVGDGRNGVDCNGRGTHVAGTAAGNLVGVAKRATVRAVRVFGCDGGTTLSRVIAAVDFVVQTAPRSAVIRMSLGDGASAALDQSVNNAALADLFVAVAAGNSHLDACNASPARAALAFSVGASDRAEVRASFPSFGPGVERFAQTCRSSRSRSRATPAAPF